MTNETRDRKTRDLPVYEKESNIVAALAECQVLVLTGETGSGKTTGIGEILYRHGYNRIVITQPRIKAATSVAEYVATLFDEEVGNTVGYASSQYKSVGPNSRIIFRTDGLQFQREAHGNGIENDDRSVIVIDEHHERSINIDMLVSFLVTRINNGEKFKLVFSSATAELERLMNWLHGELGYRPKHVHIPGRTFPVTSHNIPMSAMLTQTEELARQGRNVLVFMPGVKEIVGFIDRLEATGVDAEILPLYSDLSKVEGDRAFAAYDKAKVVVATNVAQTSITIPDIDAVVDSGQVKVPMIGQDGVQGLALAFASRADCEQRKGRAGRVKPGDYYLAGLPMEKREAFPEPQIFTGLLDGAILRLAKAGLRPERMPWFDQPKPEMVKAARKRLVKLGAMKKNHTITERGADMATFPLEPFHANMVIEARQLDVASDILAAVAVASVGGIAFEEAALPQHCDGFDCDMLAQKDMFVEAFMDHHAHVFDNEQDFDLWLEHRGIKPRRFHRARDLYEHMCERENIIAFNELKPMTKRKDMVVALATGLWVWGIWFAAGNKAYHATENERRIGRECVALDGSTLVLGTPFDILTDEKPLRVLQSIVPVTKKLLDIAIPTGLHGIQLPGPGQKGSDSKKRGGKRRKRRS